MRFAGGRVLSGGCAVGLGVGELEIGQRRMSPFAGDRVGAIEHMAAHHHAAADAGAEDHAEHGVGAGGCAVDGFRQRKAVGIVGEPHLAIQRAFEVFLQRLAVEAGRVAVLHQAGRGRDGTGGADADAAALPQFEFGLVDQRGDRGHRGGIVILRGRYTAAQDFLAGGIERDQLDFGAAEVDAET